MKRYAQKGDYMPVPNCPCLNIVSATIDFYKRSQKRLKIIFLDQTHWRMFIEDMKRVDPTYIPNATEGVPIEGSDVTVKKGSMFQTKEMQYEFYKEIELKPENFLTAAATA